MFCYFYSVAFRVMVNVFCNHFPSVYSSRIRQPQSFNWISEHLHKLFIPARYHAKTNCTVLYLEFVPAGNNFTALIKSSCSSSLHSELELVSLPISLAVFLSWTALAAFSSSKTSCSFNLPI